jgi:hypothetical protein
MTLTNSDCLRAMEKDAVLSRVRAYLVLHPKKVGYATVTYTYPKDGAGRVKCYVVDTFGNNTLKRTYASASGYGYDKATACLAHVTINGVKLYDYCGGYDDAEKRLKTRLVKLFATDRPRAERLAKKHGMRFANGGSSCYFEAGLDRLTALGYWVRCVV